MNAYAENTPIMRNAATPERPLQEGRAGRWGILGGGSLAAAAIEAICTAFVALTKLGILTGFTAFLSTLIASKYHANLVRVPVLGVATAGAALNLVLLWNRMRLRNAPAAAWRKRPLRRAERAKIATLIAMAVLTLALVAGEFWIHPLHF